MLHWTAKFFIVVTPTWKRLRCSMMESWYLFWHRSRNTSRMFRSSLVRLKRGCLNRYLRRSFSTSCLVMVPPWLKMWTEVCANLEQRFIIAQCAFFAASLALPIYAAMKDMDIFHTNAKELPRLVFSIVLHQQLFSLQTQHQWEGKWIWRLIAALMMGKKSWQLSWRF